jgi:hypothetical protein
MESSRALVAPAGEPSRRTATLVRGTALLRVAEPAVHDTLRGAANHAPEALPVLVGQGVPSPGTSRLPQAALATWVGQRSRHLAARERPRLAWGAGRGMNDVRRKPGTPRTSARLWSRRPGHPGHSPELPGLGGRRAPEPCPPPPHARGSPAGLPSGHPGESSGGTGAHPCREGTNRQDDRSRGSPPTTARRSAGLPPSRVPSAVHVAGRCVELGGLAGDDQRPRRPRTWRPPTPEPTTEWRRGAPPAPTDASPRVRQGRLHFAAPKCPGYAGQPHHRPVFHEWHSPCFGARGFPAPWPTPTSR